MADRLLSISGTGYYGEHTRNCYARLDETTANVMSFFAFFALNMDIYFPYEAEKTIIHDEKTPLAIGYSDQDYRDFHYWEEDKDETTIYVIDPDTGKLEIDDCTFDESEDDIFRTICDTRKQ